MNMTRLTYGTLRVEYGKHSLTLGLSLPYFLAEQMHGKMMPEEWDEPLTDFLFANQSVIADYTSRFYFPAFANEELQTKGRTGRKGVGQSASGSGLDQSKEKPAVRGQPGGRVGGRGLRQLSVSPRGKKVPAVKARKLARTGQKGHPTGKDLLSVVQKKWL